MKYVFGKCKKDQAQVLVAKPLKYPSRRLHRGSSLLSGKVTAFTSRLINDKFTSET